MRRFASGLFDGFFDELFGEIFGNGFGGVFGFYVNGDVETVCDCGFFASEFREERKEVTALANEDFACDDEAYKSNRAAKRDVAHIVCADDDTTDCN